jgi:hypothetical protein
MSDGTPRSSTMATQPYRFLHIWVTSSHAPEFMRYCGITNDLPSVTYCTYFTVNYLDLPATCTEYVIMTPSIPVGLQFYVVGYPRKTIANLDWTTDSATCTGTYVSY